MVRLFAAASWSMSTSRTEVPSNTTSAKNAGALFGIQLKSVDQYGPHWALPFQVTVEGNAARATGGGRAGETLDRITVQVTSRVTSSRRVRLLRDRPAMATTPPRTEIERHGVGRWGG